MFSTPPLPSRLPQVPRGLPQHNHTPELAGKAADEIEALLPKIPEGGGGHLERVGGYRGAARVLIEGFRRAAAAGEQIEFH